MALGGGGCRRKDAAGSSKTFRRVPITVSATRGQSYERTMSGEVRSAIFKVLLSTKQQWEPIAGRAGDSDQRAAGPCDARLVGAAIDADPRQTRMISRFFGPGVLLRG